MQKLEVVDGDRSPLPLKGQRSDGAAGDAIDVATTNVVECEGVMVDVMIEVMDMVTCGRVNDGRSGNAE